MTEANYKEQLNDAIDRWVGLSAERDAIEAEMAKQRQLIAALVNMLPDDEQLEFREMVEALAGKPQGLTDAIRGALRTVNAWMTASEVKQALDIESFDFSGYSSNPLSSINTVLKRLVNSGEAIAEPGKRGVPCYRWISTPTMKLAAPFKGRK